MRKQEYEPYFMCMVLVSVVILAVNIYYYEYPLFMSLGLRSDISDRVMLSFRSHGFFSSYLKTKLLSLALIVMSNIVRSGKGKPANWRTVALTGAGGLLLFLFPPVVGIVYTLLSLSGFALVAYSVAMIGRHLSLNWDRLNDVNETFEQCDEKIETKDSINIPTRYQYKGVIHNGWINVVNPFRATMILGTPGSGKSFSVYNPFIEQMIGKGYTMFIYDYKYPDLTEVVYNDLLNSIDSYPVVPEFHIINFNDPRYSERCNPIHPRYITDQAATAEVAEIIMKNVNPNTAEKEDFFSMSAKVYVDSLVWFLRIYEGGRYCSFPHLIELMGQDYEVVFDILQQYQDIEVKIRPFANALNSGAQDQLQGQIASATIPISRFASPDLYWVLSGDDFSMDINDPEHPKIICVGNNPDRQEIYGTTLALYVSRLCKTINKPGKLHSGVLLDELPTIFVKGLDNLVNTARSNKVAVVLGAQDKSQLVRDYGQKNSDVVFNTVGNIFAGQVNGKTAVDLSRSFGREFRERTSQNVSTDSESENRSLQLEDRLPVHRIETLSPGYFCGKVQDSNEKTNDFKFFCGKIIRPDTPQKDYWSKRKPTKDFEDDYRDEIMANFLQIKADVDYMVRTLADRYGIELEEDRKVREAMEKIKEAEK